MKDFDGLVRELSEVMSGDQNRVLKMRSRHLRAIERLKGL